MPHLRPTRRRAITILAGAAASLVAGDAPGPVDHAWRGTAMGADATILFSGVDPRFARECVAMAMAEIERLERALSLFRDDSEICRLNRDGVLRDPSGDLRRALAVALTTAEVTGGLFDPTVQALWEVYADWFARAPDAGPPPEAIVAGTRAVVDWRRIALAADRVTLGRGQRITLNGLGQGYVTDRVADLFRARGLHSVLVDLGEQRALGAQRDGRPWRIECAHDAHIALTDGALATSEGAGCVLGAEGAVHHLFDPRTGRSARTWRRITVHNASATIADALSTALYAASVDEIDAIVRRYDGPVDVWATDSNGDERRWARI